jgi:hypothetical protein
MVIEPVKQAIQAVRRLAEVLDTSMFHLHPSVTPMRPIAAELQRVLRAKQGHFQGVVGSMFSQLLMRRENGRHAGLHVIVSGCVTVVHLASHLALARRISKHAQAETESQVTDR